MSRHRQPADGLITSRERTTMNHPHRGLIAALACVLGLLSGGCADLPGSGGATAALPASSAQGKLALPSRDFDSIDAP
jgi:hypothetical protein